MGHASSCCLQKCEGPAEQAGFVPQTHHVSPLSSRSVHLHAMASEWGGQQSRLTLCGLVLSPVHLLFSFEQLRHFLMPSNGACIVMLPPEVRGTSRAGWICAADPPRFPSQFTVCASSCHGLSDDGGQQSRLAFMWGWCCVLPLPLSVHGLCIFMPWPSDVWVSRVV